MKYYFAQMKRRTTSGNQKGKIVKTSISLPDVLVTYGEDQVKNEGFNSFSSYLAHLIRVDKNRVESKGAIKAARPPLKKLVEDYEDRKKVAISSPGQTSNDASPRTSQKSESAPPGSHAQKPEAEAHPSASPNASNRVGKSRKGTSRADKP